MKTVVSWAALALLLGACATDPATGDQQAASNGREETVVCGMEEPTGSRLRVKRCWTKEELEREGDDARRTLERGQSQRPPPRMPGQSR